MSGLDKIVEEIHAQAKAEADLILNKSDEYCDAYMEDVKKEVQKELEAFHKKALAERNLYEEKTKSGAEFLERNAILRAKQQCIDEVLVKAEQTIKNFPVGEYFGFLEKLLEKNIQSGHGIMYLGKKDLERMPENFEEKVQAIAKKKNGTIELCREPKNITDGFILAYGEIEENCTIKSLFHTNLDRMKDIAGKELFG